VKKVYVLDACALIAALREEQGVDIVASLLKRSSQGEIVLCIH